LTELEELRGMRASLALAATGGVLLERIERLLGQLPTRQRGTALASACALATLTALTASVSAPLLTEELAAAGFAAPNAVTIGDAAPIAQRVVRDAPPARSDRAATPTADRRVVGPAPVAGAGSLVPERAEPEPAAATIDGAIGTAPATSGELSLLPVDAPVASDAPSAAGAGPVITGGQQLVGAAPSYPYRARSRGLGGTVTARLLVDASGLTRAVEVVAADPPELFDRAVVRALSNWRFAPLYEDGVAREREVIQQLEFVPDAAACHLVTGTRLCRKVGGEHARRSAGVTVIRLR